MPDAAEFLNDWLFDYAQMIQSGAVAVVLVIAVAIDCARKDR